MDEDMDFACYKCLYRKPQENYKEYELEHLFSLPRFKPGTSQMKSRSSDPAI
jgi:hypothetical protein